MNTISITLFGSLSDATPDGTLTIEADAEESIGDIRARIRLLLDHHPLLESSVLASNEEILAESDRLGTRKRIVVLPPVCGG